MTTWANEKELSLWRVKGEPASSARVCQIRASPLMRHLMLTSVRIGWHTQSSFQLFLDVPGSFLLCLLPVPSLSAYTLITAHNLKKTHRRSDDGLFVQNWCNCGSALILAMYFLTAMETYQASHLWLLHLHILETTKKDVSFIFCTNFISLPTIWPLDLLERCCNTRGLRHVGTSSPCGHKNKLS